MKEDGLDIFGMVSYNIPKRCSKCGGIMIYKGVGDYECENCGEPAQDDYGKVRTYIEHHQGCNAAEIELHTGVSQKAIRQMLKESRIEITADSKSFLKCEICGRDIRSGRYCSDCEMKVHRRYEDQLREEHQKGVHGVGMGQEGESGQKRFTRDR